MPAATAAAAPPLDPPAVRSGFHGLLVRPKDVVRALVVGQEGRHVGVADEDRASSSEAGRDRSILVGDPVEDRSAHRGP